MIIYCDVKVGVLISRMPLLRFADQVIKHRVPIDSEFYAWLAMTVSQWDKYF